MQAERRTYRSTPNQASTHALLSLVAIRVDRGGSDRGGGLRVPASSPNHSPIHRASTNHPVQTTPNHNPASKTSKQATSKIHVTRTKKLTPNAGCEPQNTLKKCCTWHLGQDVPRCTCHVVLQGAGALSTSYFSECLREPDHELILLRLSRKSSLPIIFRLCNHSLDTGPNYTPSAGRSLHHVSSLSTAHLAALISP